MDGVLVKLKACLDSAALPAAGEDCDYCKYRDAVEQVLGGVGGQAQVTPHKAPSFLDKIAKKEKDNEKSKKKDATETTSQLF